ncbi:MAG: hypothetical protein ACRDI1_06470 [Actinomycetota bacterium]
MIPRSRDLAGSTMTHRPSDLFNPPALTNFLGCVQADVDPVGIRNLNFPPFACSNVASGLLYVDGRIFAATGQPVTLLWRPDRIERTASAEGLEIRSTTVLVWGEQAAVVTIEIRNSSGTHRSFEIGLGLTGSVTRQDEPWGGPLPPMDPANTIEVDQGRTAVVFGSSTGAVNIQGLPTSGGRARKTGINLDAELGPGEVWQGAFLSVIAPDEASGVATYDRLAADPRGEVERTEQQWDLELESVFTPDGGRYSGSVPVLETSDSDLLRLYHLGLLGVVYFKRESDASVVGRTYDTLMPRYWQTSTFLWDYSLSSLVHALLDPEVMRGHLEMWMSKDIHRMFATEWLTGSPVGRWYSVNDHAMCWMILQYLRFSGDFGWIEQKVETSGGEKHTVLRFLEEYATAWRDFEKPSGLADYGDIGNLLECVSTYVHEVAAMNAASVWNLRAAADVLSRLGETARAAALREEADLLRKKVWELYEEGGGYWNSRLPDGTLVGVRHAYDFLTITNLLAGDLSENQKSEMTDFFLRELQTETWMHALSPKDPNAVYSVRPDHQFNGAYTAWPARTAEGLFKIGRGDIAAGWMRGLAASANQGPFGQAHFVEKFAEPESGGARKASAEFPYINDWACSSGGAWAELVINSVFGVQGGLDGVISATPQLDRFDPDARLTGLRFQGNHYTVDAAGIRKESP